MKHYLAELTGSSTTTGSLNVGGILSIPGHDDVSASLASISASAANSVSSFTDLTNVPSGLVSASAQVDFDSIQNTNNIVSSSAQISYSSITNVPSGIISSSEQFNSFDTAFTGSFSGSFVGDGSGLTGVEAEVVETATIEHTFTNVSSTVVTHNFETKNVIVAVYVGDEIIYPDTIETNSDNQVTVTFTSPRTGRVVVAKGGHVVSGSVNEVTGGGTGNPVAVWSSENTLTNYSALTFNGTTLGLTGNMTVTGTIDGRDIATDGTKLDGIESNADVTDTTNVKANLPAGVISGSSQIATDISGAFDAASASLASDIAGITTFTTSGTDIVSGSAQITSALLNQNLNLGTGTLTANELITNIVSSSVLLTTGSNIFGDETSDTHEFTGSVEMQNDLTVSGDISGTFINVISESAQIASDISGAFDSVSSSLASDIAGIITFTTDGTDIVSSSAQIATDISGAFDAASSSLAEDINSASIENNTSASVVPYWDGDSFEDSNISNAPFFHFIVDNFDGSDATFRDITITSTQLRIELATSTRQKVTPDYNVFIGGTVTFGTVDPSEDFDEISGNSYTIDAVSGLDIIVNDTFTGFGGEREIEDDSFTTPSIVTAGGLTITGDLTVTTGSISGSFIGDGSGLTGVIADGTLSSSAQIASDISGAFDSLSSSLAEDINSASIENNTSASVIPYWDGDSFEDSQIGFSSESSTTVTTLENRIYRFDGHTSIPIETSPPVGDISLVQVGDILTVSTHSITYTITSVSSDRFSITPGLEDDLVTNTSLVITRTIAASTTVTGDLTVTGDVTGSFVGDGSGLTGVTVDGTISSSAQIASDISGAFDSVSSSLASDIAGITTFTTDGTNIVSGSAQIATDISGAFDSVSASLAEDINSASSSLAEDINSASIENNTSTNTIPYWDGNSFEDSSIEYTPAVNRYFGIAAFTGNSVTNAATLTFTISTGTVEVGDVFDVQIRLNNFGSTIETFSYTADSVSGNTLTASVTPGTPAPGSAFYYNWNGQSNINVSVDALTTVTGDITGSFVGDGSGLTGITMDGALSSSAQIATDISGAFDAASASLASDIAGITTFTTAGTDIVSGSSQIATDISGAFDSVSASLAEDINSASIENNTSASVIPYWDGDSFEDSTIRTTPGQSVIYDFRADLSIESDGGSGVATEQTANRFPSAVTPVVGASGNFTIAGYGDITVTITTNNGDDTYNFTIEPPITHANPSLQANYIAEAEQIIGQGDASFTEPSSTTITGDLTVTGDITGSFVGDGSGLTGITMDGALSSSAQIATDISGAFDSVSASLAEDINSASIENNTSASVVPYWDGDSLEDSNIDYTPGTTSSADFTETGYTFSNTAALFGIPDGTFTFQNNGTSNVTPDYSDSTDGFGGVVDICAIGVANAADVQNIIGFAPSLLGFGGGFQTLDEELTFTHTDSDYTATINFTHYVYDTNNNDLLLLGGPSYTTPVDVVSSSGGVISNGDDVTIYRNFTQGTPNSTTVTGDLTVTGDISGSFIGDGSQLEGVVSASYASTSSVAVNQNEDSGSIKFWHGSQTEYDAISSSADINTIYFVV